MLSGELERLVAQLVELDRSVVSVLVPGVDAAVVQEQLRAQVPVEVATWFGWCNGVAVVEGQVQDDVNVIPGYGPLSVAQAVRMKADYEGDPVLGSNWVPLLGGAGGDIYAAVWVEGESPKVAGVLVGEPTGIEFESIDEMVSFFVSCYQRGAFGVDVDGRLTMDADLCDLVYSEVVG